MHKLLLPITVLMLFVGQGFSQGQFKLPKKKIRCYTAENMQEFNKTNPSAATDQDFENWLQPLIYQFKKTHNAGAQNGTLTSYKVPIVFHIIYNGEAEGTASNVSQASIIEEVLQLNKDYADLSNSQYAVASSTGIQFGLAAVNPSGVTLAEPGIDRQDIATNGWSSDGPPFNDAGTSTGYFWTTIKKATIWDPTKYVNVWVADIASGTAGIVGISTFPVIPAGVTTVPGLTPANETATNAGIIVDYTTIGSVFAPSQNGLNSAGQCGSNPYNQGKTATHELGHYFGLRHVWGDAQPACGNDYVGDTPPTSNPNYGTPVHPEPDKVCGSADQIFEDYMDYSDDHCMTTFTADQVARMQTVMANSTNRKTLPNAVAMVDPVGDNEIAFEECSGEIVVKEGGISGTYPRYRDTSINLNIDQAASDNTSVLTVVDLGTGTAVAGVDYQIMNPNISFAKGDSYKAIQLRIFDNATIDGDRYLDLGYTITGTGVVAGSSSQTLRVTIVDDDNIKIGQNRTSLVNQNFGTSGGTLPANWYAFGSTGNPNSFVVGSVASTGMTGQYAYVTSNTTTKPNTYKTGTSGACVLEFLVNGLSMVSLDTFAFTYKIGGLAAGPDDAYALYYDIHDTLSNWDYYGAAGTGNNTGYGPYVSQTTAKRLSLIPTADMPNKKMVQMFYFETGTTAGGKQPGFNIDSIVLRGMPFKVETTLSSSYGFDVPALSYNVYRSSNNNAMLIFKDGPTAMSGLTASIVDAGTTQVTFNTAAGTYNRAKKVYKLARTAVDNASLDSIVFYYTTAELAVWGSKISSLKVLQVNDGVNYTSTLNSGNSVLLTPTVDTTRSITDSVYTFTVFTKGLGTFMLVDPTTILPLNWISFKGALKENYVELDWSTTNEFNTNGFEIERSTDGETYSNIGWVNSLGGVNLNNYTYNDHSIVKGNKYYYRLKQEDKDGKFTYSSVVIIAYLGGNKWVNIYPNPVKDNLFIQRQNGSNSNTNIVITDASGKVVYQNVNSLSSTLEVQTSNWSRGIYIVKLNSDEGSSTIKIVKE